MLLRRFQIIIHTVTADLVSVDNRYLSYSEVVECVGTSLTLVPYTHTHKNIISAP